MDRLPRRVVVSRIAIGATAMAVLGASLFLRSSSQPTVAVRAGAAGTSTTLTEEQAVQHAFGAAMSAEHEMMVPTGSPVSTPYAVLTSSQIEAARARGAKAIAAHFSGPAATQAAHELDLAMQATSSPNQEELGAGVSRIVYKSVSLTSTTEATVEAIVTVWSRQAGRQPGGPWTVFTPSNQEDTTAIVSLTSTGWTVSSVQWKFVDGTGP